MLKALDDSGESENTIVVVTSDNGMAFPRAKSNLYDYGTRMPLAIRWPAGSKGGRRVDDMVSLIDLAPTFLEAAGLPVPAAMRGRSLVPLLASSQSGRIDSLRNRVYFGKERHAWVQKGGEINSMRGLRTRDHLYIRYLKPHLNQAGSPEAKYNWNFQPYGDYDGMPTSTS
jgi:arylsulfatase A-like enzyme